MVETVELLGLIDSSVGILNRVVVSRAVVSVKSVEIVGTDDLVQALNDANNAIASHIVTQYAHWP